MSNIMHFVKIKNQNFTFFKIGGLNLYVFFLVKGLKLYLILEINCSDVHKYYTHIHL
jgi:hypothetical protein